MSETRLNWPQVAPRQLGAMLALEHSVDLDTGLLNLVKVRASQINGCALCIDMHWKDARAGGESEERLYALDAWREYPVYSTRERAALELCEAMTLIAGSHVADVVWSAAAAVFSEGELAQLIVAIATVNAWNRLNIATRLEPGRYRAVTSA
jgi:AhpD family alkylhydroperoxidase